MSTINRPFALLLVPVAVSLGVIGAVNAGQSGSQPVRCEIQVKEHADNVVFDAVVFAQTAIGGSYQFSISKSGGSGSSDIDQSGDFATVPGGPSILGTATLGGNGGSYVAKLKVTSDGRTIECSERVGGAL